MAFNPKWGSIDVIDGVVDFAKKRGFRIYVHENGSWWITDKTRKRIIRRSDHRTRGTNMELGKQAVLEIFQRYFL